MPRIKDTSIEEIRNRVNIHDLVSAYVSLKKSGSSFKGLSPFTSEKTPSFMVYPDRGFYYCFSTSQGGDIFKFVQVKENLNFPEAIEFIANRFGIALEYEDVDGNASKEGLGPKKQIYELNEEAAAWFSENFISKTDLGAEARKYWYEDRGFPKASARDLRIGVAPIDWAEFKKKIEKKYSYEAFAESGLFFAPKNRANFTSFMPRFRGRLMIPICDVQGRVVGFTARKTKFTPTDIDYEEGKYVNSPETPIFKKQNLLFNFDKARKPAADKGYFILVEGQIDAMRMFVSGFENTVAGQGTAIGETQLMMMRRHAPKLLLLLDGDKAGLKAAQRVLPLSLKADLEALICVLPEGEDPDSLILKGGADAMKALLKKSQSPVAFLVSNFKKNFPNPTAGDKRQILSEIYELVDSTSSYVVKDEYLREASHLLGTEYSAISGDYLKRKNKVAESPQRSANKERSVLTNVAYGVLLVLLNMPDLVSVVSANLDLDWLDDDSVENILLKRILAYHRNGVQFDLAEIESADERNLAYEIKAKHIIDSGSVAQTLADDLEKIHKNYCESKMKKLNERMLNANESAQAKEAILIELSKLRKLIRNTKFKIEL